MYIPFPPTDPGIKFPNFDIFFLSFDNLSFLFNNRDVFGIILELISLAVKRDKEDKKKIQHKNELLTDFVP